MSDRPLFTQRAPCRLRVLDHLLSQQIREDEKYHTPLTVPACIAHDRAHEEGGPFPSWLSEMAAIGQNRIGEAA